MRLKLLRDKAQAVVLVGGALCLFSASWVVHLYLNRLADFLFGLSFITTLVSAVLVFPRWKTWAGVAALVLSVWWSGGRAFATYHSTNPSPDGRYKLVAYSVPLPFAFPGQGSDAPGYVQLQDGSGRLLNEGYVGMVQIVYEADWRAQQVEIGRGDGSYTWALPR